MSIEQEIMKEIQIESQYNDDQSHEKQVSRRKKKRSINIKRRREKKEKKKRLKAIRESSVQKKLDIQLIIILQSEYNCHYLESYLS
jgi:hypothetical protein